MATWIKADGTVEEVAPADGSDFKLEELRRFIGGGNIEIVPLRSHAYAGHILVIDEDGKRGLPLNRRATLLYYGGDYPIPGDFIAGDALLCKDAEVR